MPESKDLSHTMRLEIPPEAAEGYAPPSTPVPPRTVRVRAAKDPSAGVGGDDFQQLLQHVYDAALITDHSGHVRDANLRAEQFLRLSREDLRGRNILEIISGADETLLPKIRESLAQSRFILLQASCVRADGSLFPSEIAINRLTLSAREFLCFFVRDIAWRREAEERLLVEHVAMHNAASGIAIATMEGRLLYVNPAVVRLLGAEDESIFADQPLTALLDPPDEIQAAVKAVQAHGCWGGELSLARADDTVIHLQVAATVARDADGEATGMVFSFNDITARRLAEEQLSQYAAELQARNAQMEADLTMAREVQRALLPRALPALPLGAPDGQAALRFASVYRPSAAVGGDFFHLRPLGDRAAGVFVCDVMGHGMRAALITAIVRGLIEEARPVADDPGAVLGRLNRALVAILRQPGEFLFVSALYAVVDAARGELRLAVAGHPSPLRLAAATGALDETFGAGAPRGPALGIREAHAYGTAACPLRPGDRLLFYTDGLVEAENAAREEWGEERLRASLQAEAERPLAAWVEATVNAAAAFAADVPFEDDICAVAVELGVPAGGG